MVYKSLNTFIDDLFAWVIKMPLMHRLSCFRDDAIFLVLLYQMWTYKVDETRKNEFGASKQDYEEWEDKKKNEKMRMVPTSRTVASQERAASQLSGGVPQWNQPSVSQGQRMDSISERVDSVHEAKKGEIEEISKID